MAEPALENILNEARIPDEGKAFLVAFGIITVAILATVATNLDQLIERLATPFEKHDHRRHRAQA